MAKATPEPVFRGFSMVPPTCVGPVGQMAILLQTDAFYLRPHAFSHGSVLLRHVFTEKSAELLQLVRPDAGAPIDWPVLWFVFDRNGHFLRVTAL